MDYLVRRGWGITEGWQWVLPSPDHEPTDTELEAITYLVEEWDYGGIRSEP